MQIRRREFVVAALSAVPASLVIGPPAFAAVPEPSPRAAGEAKSEGSGFSIAGWGAPADVGGDQVLIQLSSSWRAAWH
jgi:hypothetical protein